MPRRDFTSSRPPMTCWVHQPCRVLTEKIERPSFSIAALIRNGRSCVMCLRVFACIFDIQDRCAGLQSMEYPSHMKRSKRKLYFLGECSMYVRGCLTENLSPIKGRHGQLRDTKPPYFLWCGCHWSLNTLADRKVVKVPPKRWPR